MKAVSTKEIDGKVYLEIPSDFKVPAGATFEPKQVNNGIFYKAVDQKPSYDFTSEILEEVIEAGFTGDDVIKEFNRRKEQLRKILGD